MAIACRIIVNSPRIIESHPIAVSASLSQSPDRNFECVFKWNFSPPSIVPALTLQTWTFFPLSPQLELYYFHLNTENSINRFFNTNTSVRWARKALKEISLTNNAMCGAAMGIPGQNIFRKCSSFKNFDIKVWGLSRNTLDAWLPQWRVVVCSCEDVQKLDKQVLIAINWRWMGMTRI